MKQLSKKILPLLIFLALFVSCVDTLENYNTDKTGFSEDAQKADYFWYGLPLTAIQKGIYFNYDWGKGKNWPFQTMQNLNIDMFAGYFHNYKFKHPSNSMYDLNDVWNSTLWEFTYGYIMPEVKQAEIRNKEDMPEFYGISKILKVELMHRLCDVYGPIIYSKFGDSKLGSMPDSQEDVYMNFFDDLDEACGILLNHKGEEKFARFDILMPPHKKNYAQWVKFANSLRLRLAMRISKIAPEKAKHEAQKALAPENGGVLELDDEIVAVHTDGTGYLNPLGEINKAWGEVFMNANMESILVGFQDPRLQKYFEPATGSIYIGEYRGIRQGTGFNHNKYENHSKSTITRSSKAILMTAAEVWFLRSEAALRSWSDESAKECYENGIKASFKQWNCTDVDTYLQNEQTANDYTDTFNSEYNIKAQSEVSPKWFEHLSNEEKLEKIITQKWIACYPEGCEAWAEQRRTGYPRLFPVMLNLSNGTIDTDTMIRRINFPFRIKSINNEQYLSLCSLLNGADNGGTRLWWDTEGANF